MEFDVTTMVLILGGESSGKTTLAKALADKYDGTFVPEYGRQLFEEQNGVLSEFDFDKIVKTQIKMEVDALLNGDEFIFCDTNALVTQFYKQETVKKNLFDLSDVNVFTYLDSSMDYDFIILCRNDFDFVQDGTRQNLEFANRQFQFYKSFLDKIEQPYIIVEGDVEKRLKIFHDFMRKSIKNV